MPIYELLLQRNDMAGRKNAGLLEIILLLASVVAKQAARARVARRNRRQQIGSDNRIDLSGDQQIVQPMIGIAVAGDWLDAYAVGYAVFLYPRRQPVDAFEVHPVIMLQRATRPHPGGVVPLHDADPPAFQIFCRLDARFAVDEYIGEAKLTVGKSRDRNMRFLFRISAHARCESAVPGVALIFVGNELPFEAVDLHRAVGNWNIGVDGRFTKIEFQFWIGHDYPPFTIILERPSHRHQLLSPNRAVG